MLKILFWICLIPAVLYVLLMSFISGRIIGLGIAAGIMILIAVLNAYFDRRRSKNSLKPAYTAPSKGPRVFKSAIFGVVLVIGAIPILGIGGFTINCHIIQRKKADKAFAPVMQQFDAVYFVDQATKPTTVVSKGGDCVDSRPWVSVTKSQKVNSKPAEILANLETALQEQGYDLDKSSISYRYTSSYADPNRCSLEISTQIVARDTTSPYKTFAMKLSSNRQTCDSGVIASKDYSNIPITNVALYAQKS